MTDEKPDETAEEKPKKASRPPRARAGRKSGDTAATEEANKQVEEMTEPPRTEEVPEERAEWWRSPGFRRMPTAWQGEDKMQMDRAQVLVSDRVFYAFSDAYQIMYDLYDIVREQVVDLNTGSVQLDHAGNPVWARTEYGGYIEDWSQLTLRQREDFLFRITTGLFNWEQKAADFWAESMFAKGRFTEHFATAYDTPMSGTIDDRNARGNVEAAEDRYFALLQATVSRKADALVRTMTQLMLRLKETLG